MSVLGKDNKIGIIKLSLIISILFYVIKIVLIDFDYDKLGEMESTFSVTLSPLIAGIVVGVLLKIAINIFQKKSGESISAATYLFAFVSYIVSFIGFILFAVYFDSIVLFNIPGYPIWFIFSIIILVAMGAIMFIKIKGFINDIKIEDEE